MSLHKATEIIKKILIFAGGGIGAIIILVMIFKFGAILKSIISPPKIIPPNQAYGTLPPLQFPRSEFDNDYTYTLNTVSGALPIDFPGRLVIYPVSKATPNLLNLDKAKNKALALKFMDQMNKPIPEISLGNGLYEWNDPSGIGINRRLKMNIVTFDFSLSSSYLTSLTVLGAQNLSDENNAVQTVKEVLTSIQLMPTDIDITKTTTPSKDTNNYTYPQLFTITNGVMQPTTSLSSAKVIRVDLYQKDIEYNLDTGKPGAAKIKIKLPVFYPSPPYSTMSFWVASGQSNAEIDAAEFIHREITIPTENIATYPIKTVSQAFEELKNGSAYIASYSGLDKEILINKVYLAYYLGGQNEEYLMPIIVFEGQKGFFAYVSAVKY